MIATVIDWKLLTENCRPKMEADFMVVSDVGDKEEAADFGIYHWYNKGTKVLCRLKKEYRPLDMGKLEEILSPEELFYVKVFVNNESREIEIPEDGFYKITGDYHDEDYHEGEYEEFSTIPEIFYSCSNKIDVYWAPLPPIPTGLIHPYNKVNP